MMVLVEQLKANMKEIKFINTCGGGRETAATIKANYWKVSLQNFVHKDGRRATGVIEYDTNGRHSEDDTCRML